MPLPGQLAPKVFAQPALLPARWFAQAQMPPPWLLLRLPSFDPRCSALALQDRIQLQADLTGLLPEIDPTEVFLPSQREQLRQISHYRCREARLSMMPQHHRI